MGANCICIYRQDDEHFRHKIEADLSDNYDLPCNDNDIQKDGVGLWHTLGRWICRFSVG